MRTNELEERLIDFAVSMIAIAKSATTDYASRHLFGQLIRSGTAPALNYGEAQSAESHKDFVHKLGICLKELRESLVNLKIINRANLFSNKELLENIIGENDQLIAIFVSSIKTSKAKNSKIRNG